VADAELGGEVAQGAVLTKPPDSLTLGFRQAAYAAALVGRPAGPPHSAALRCRCHGDEARQDGAGARATPVEPVISALTAPRRRSPDNPGRRLPSTDAPRRLALPRLVPCWLPSRVPPATPAPSRQAAFERLTAAD
jgi:hypothetical protein